MILMDNRVNSKDSSIQAWHGQWIIQIFQNMFDGIRFRTKDHVIILFLLNSHETLFCDDSCMTQKMTIRALATK